MKYSTKCRRYIIEKNGNGKYRVRVAYYLFGLFNWANNYLIKEVDYIINDGPSYYKTTYRVGNFLDFDIKTEKEAEEQIEGYIRQEFTKREEKIKNEQVLESKEI